MPLFEETITIPSVNDTTTNVHVFGYGLPINVKNPGKKLICTDSCMTYNRMNFSNIEESERETILSKGCEFDGYFVRTISGPYDLCLKISASNKGVFMRRFSLEHVPEPDPSVATDAIVVDHNGDYYGVFSGPHFAFCQARDLNLAGVPDGKISLPLGGIKLYFQKTTSRPTEIPYAAYKATFEMPEIIHVGNPIGEEFSLHTEEIKNESFENSEVTVSAVSAQVSPSVISSVKVDAAEQQNAVLPPAASSSQDVRQVDVQKVEAKEDTSGPNV